MKIAFVIHSLSSGGSERVTVNLAGHWAEKGWEVLVVTFASQEWDFYRLHPRVHRIALGLGSESANVGAGVRNNLRRALALRAVLRHTRPEIALAMGTTTNVLLTIAARGIRGLVCIGSERIYPPQVALGQSWEMFRRYLYGSLDAVVTMTTESATWLRDHTRAKSVPVIPNAVPWPLPLQEPILSVSRYVSNDRHLLLTVGRLDPQKGFELLIEGFSRIADKHTSWDLIIIGDGPSRRVLESQVRELGLRERVALLGRAGNIGDWYSRADLYALSSHFEGFPNTLLEALAYGVPAVTFDCNTGPRDIIRHEVDGLLVPTCDLRGLVAALDRLMGDADLRQCYAARAVEARERFSLMRIAGMWEDLFSELMQ